MLELLDLGICIIDLLAIPSLVVFPSGKVAT